MSTHNKVTRVKIAGATFNTLLGNSHYFKPTTAKTRRGSKNKSIPVLPHTYNLSLVRWSQDYSEFKAVWSTEWDHVSQMLKWLFPFYKLKYILVKTTTKKEISQFIRSCQTLIGNSHLYRKLRLLLRHLVALSYQNWLVFCFFWYCNVFSPMRRQ